MANKQYTKTGPLAFAGVCKDEALSSEESIIIGKVEVGNSSGDAARCGFGVKQPDAMWKAGHWDDSEVASYTDDTVDAQDAGADDFAIGSDGEDDDGFVVQSIKPFSVVGVTISTAETGAAGVYAYEYWNGSAWTALPVLASPDWTSTGDAFIEFLRPLDWAPLVSTDAPVATDGLDAGMFAMRCVTSTAAGTTAALASLLWVVELLDYVEAVPDGKSVILNSNGEIKLPYHGSVIPYCSVADAANWINLEYRLGG